MVLILCLLWVRTGFINHKMQVVMIVETLANYLIALLPKGQVAIMKGIIKNNIIKIKMNLKWIC